MAELSNEEIADRIEAFDGHDRAGLGSLIAQHEDQLRAAGRHDLLAFGYFRAGRHDDAYRAVDRVDAATLETKERRLLYAIRHQRRVDRRSRLSLYMPSNKRFSRRVRDGLMNLFRHGRLRNPISERSRLPAMLHGANTAIRAARQSDAQHLRTLLDANETAYREHGHDKFLSFNYYHAGCLSKAAAHARGLDRSELSADERIFADNILFEWRALERMRAGQPPVEIGAMQRPARTAPERPKALYLVASSLPYIVSGYTSRSEAIVTALGRDDRLQLVATSRPGFPWDRSDARDTAAAERGEATFKSLRCDASYQGDLETYIADALERLEEWARAQSIDIVHGVSNYRNAVIGLALARKLGLPFVYEIRGLWEETADTKRRGWRDTERFEFERSFEKFLFRSADGVLPINEQVQAVLEDEPHPNAERLPNCVRADRIVKRPRVEHDGITIGYVGSLLEYEGLDDLIHAVASVQEGGQKVRLDIFGRGADHDRLKSLVRDSGVDNVTLHGAVPPEDVPVLYRDFDLCVFPRKPYRVCQLVTPLKPLEAMANDVNVIVSDVAPLEKFARRGAAHGFEAGNVEALAKRIEEFIGMDETARQDVRDRARAMLQQDFVWEQQGETVANVYRRAYAAALPESPVEGLAR